MTITPTPPLTLEPWKRTLRTIIAVVIASASAALLIVALPQLQTVDPTSKVGIILTWVTVVSGAITRFAASDAGNYVFGLIGLDAAHVVNVKKASAQVVSDVAPVVAPVAPVVVAPVEVAPVEVAPVVAPVEVAPVAVPLPAPSAPAVPSAADVQALAATLTAPVGQ